MSGMTDGVAALGAGPLTDALLRRHVDPLFSRVLARPGIYMANHSLGRPPDQTADDVAEGVALWYAHLGDAWEPWIVRQDAVRAGVGRLLGVARADCIIPKTSAGQGLRTVLNGWEGVPRVVSTRGEFDSIDVILRHYRERGRLELHLIEPDTRGWFHTADILKALEQPTDLLVLSQVMFMTGQLLTDLPAIVERAHAQGARVLIDTYHAVGVVPVDLTGLQADFAIGGGYKYLRGGPGSCWLYVRPDIVDTGRVPLDTGWFAKEAPFSYQRPDPPRFARGGDGFQESTPPVLIPYQAAAGLAFTSAIGVARLREYSLSLARALVGHLADAGVEAEGGREDMGAFVVIRHDNASAVAHQLAELGIKCDARARYLRLTPDILTRSEELDAVVPAVAKVLKNCR